jgi:SAM-dependent methyltransferase
MSEMLVDGRKRLKLAGKIFLKRLHGWIYCQLLPLLVKPPHIVRNGQIHSLTRAGILDFLEYWQSRVHGRVLDVGVGTWVYPRQLLQDVCDYTATDCFEHPNVDVVSDIHALTEVFAPDSFDFVICTDVLEHIPRPWIAVRQLYAVLKTGGTLLLTTPFNFHLHGNEMVKDYGRLSADGLRVLLLEEAGFREAMISPVGHPEFPFSHTVVAQK